MAKKDVQWVARTKDGQQFKFDSEQDAKRNRPQGSWYGAIVLKTGNFFRHGPRWYPERRDHAAEYARRKALATS